MLSFAKIALIAVVVLAVIAFARGQRAQRERAARRRPPPVAPTETLERCAVCGVFRAPGDAFVCGRDDCPTRQKS